jgi:hypothetical protein
MTETDSEGYYLTAAIPLAAGTRARSDAAAGRIYFVHAATKPGIQEGLEKN